MTTKALNHQFLYPMVVLTKSSKRTEARNEDKKN